MENNTVQEKKNRKIWPFVIIFLLVAALVAVIWFAFFRDTGFERYEFDTEAMAGRIQQMSAEEIQAELNRVVEEGMFNISIASSIVFESPTGKGEARIENIEANHYHMQVDLILDETQEVIYSSKLIQPGYSIQHIKLNQKLEPGVYEATAIFSAITQQEQALFGQAAAQVTLYIPNEDGRIPMGE